jgi:hydantoinase/carbamoylase family amidase
MMESAYPRLRSDLDALADFGRDPVGGWSRLAFSAADQQVHRWFMDRAIAAGLAVRMDSFGNVIARLEGPPGAGTIAIGSHLDTVQNGGLLDGALGVLAGLEVARRLIETEAERRHAIEVIAFRDEEGRFGAFSGSRAMMGSLSAADIARMRASDGTGLVDAMREAGFDPDRVGEAGRNRHAFGAYLELHIEQGPVLESKRQSIGVVSAIAGQERLSVRFNGAPDHAGTTPMDMRRDAFAAAARFSDQFRSLILAEGGAETRGTIGIVKVLPNAGNVVPSEVRIGLEIRDIAADRLMALSDRVTALAGEVAANMNVELQVRRVFGSTPVPMNGELAALLAASARDLGHDPVSLPSGAGHDAAIIADAAPVALLFIPSVGGRSHCPEEHTNWPDIVAGLAVLEEAVRRLSASPLPNGPGAPS